ncbi:hypothetical protein GCM10010994_02440 [Chelatococcus reniformis]|uniref:Glycosyltransferase 2-like domain-containing protein n=1 Tax=Chelatococcus reniformis TaxID=1494448 RepID=A0A916TWI9_9HYPH|nr:hypothetical protein GCM10010994_02440 [Chelatococcus reniformis]
MRGHLDEISEDGWASGWAQDDDDRGQPILLEFAVNERIVGVIAADQFRQDLRDAGFANPNCAFWFKLPDDAFEEGTYLVSVRAAGNGAELRNSPQQVQVGSLEPSARAQAANLLPNADFQRWPRSVSVTVAEGLTEVAEGWFVEADARMPARVVASLAKPVGMGLADDECALKIATGQLGGRVWLIVPLDARPQASTACSFSCSFRRPLGGAEPGLRCAAIRLSVLDGAARHEVEVIGQDVAASRSVRVADVPVVLDPEVLARHSPGARFALTFEFVGAGELVIALPWLGLPLRPRVVADSPERFEDANVFEQAQMLKLSPIWSAGVRAVPSPAAPQPPRPAAPVSPTGVQQRLPFVQIVVPVFNAVADTLELIDSILREARSPIEIIVADDHSSPFLLHHADTWHVQDPRIRVLRNAENVGYTRNVNLALQTAVADFVVLINSDTVVSPGWLERMMAVLLADETVAAVGPVSNAASWQSVPLTKGRDGQWVVNVLPGALTVADMARTVSRASLAAHPEFPLLNGFCTLFRRAALDGVGHFDDESFPSGYGEENDLCIRLGRAGWKLRVADDAYVFHKKSRSFGADVRAELSGRTSQVLAAKYPEIVIADLEETMRACEPLNALRRRLGELLASEGAAGMNDR